MQNFNLEILNIEDPRFKRIKKIRDFMLSSEPRIDPERARIYTNIFKENVSKPLIIKRALGLQELLRSKKISIYDNELIVGNFCSSPRSAYIFPEYSVDYVLEELDGKPYRFDKRPGDRFEIDEKISVELKDICKWWKGQTTHDLINAAIPEKTQHAYDSGIINIDWLLTGGQGHLVPNFNFVLCNGLKRYIEKIDDLITNLDTTNPDKLNFYHASKIILNAIKEYADRFSELAAGLAAKEENIKRKRELEQISKICKHVPYNPARTLQEALQSIWFIQGILQMEDSGHSMSLGRLDQTLYSYYLIEKEKGASPEKIIELFANFWLKLFDINKVRSWEGTKYFSGYPLFQNITIGGQRGYGIDATNDLSYIILLVQSLIRLPAPSVSLRYHNNIDEKLLNFTLDVIELGGGQPAIYSDEVMVPALLNRGVDLEDSLNYCIVGCVEPHVEGKEGYRPNGACFFNMPKILELTLFNGKDLRTGQTGIQTHKNIDDIISFKEFYDELKEQFKYYLYHHVLLDNMINEIFAKNMPNALVSTLIDDCIERGKTIDEGGAIYDIMGDQMLGLANLGNSIASIKRNVFDNKNFTLKELKEAMMNNFKGEDGERIKKFCLDAPKYGNDIDYVDFIARDIFEFICIEYASYNTIRYGKGPRVCKWVPSTSTISGNVPFGKYIMATPDGRSKEEPLSDGISAYMGTDTKGLTAVVKSAGKLNNVLVTGGQLFNLKVDSVLMKTKKKALKDLIKVYCGDFKGMHIQFNILDNKILLDAKKYPEKYPNIMVRVAGYSALFVSLDPEVQDMIIERTLHLMS